jgi:hypothetical protein
MKYFLLIIILSLWQSINVNAQATASIESFNLSECKANCAIKADLISKSKILDTLFIEAGINLNCCGDFMGSFDLLSNDTLNLIIENQPNKDGILRSCSCNCYYVAKYKISNLKLNPRIILINGQTFQENRNHAGWEEVFPKIKD